MSASVAARLLDVLGRQRVLGIVRAPDTDAAALRLGLMINAGLEAVEVSLSTPGALDVVASTLAGAVGSGSGAVVGVGMVFSAAELDAAGDAGAQFVVTPTTDTGVLAAARARGLPVVCGAATPTEVRTALDGGALAVKLFPAGLWPVSAFKDLRGVFETVPFVPTGGIGVDDARSWIDAGALAVGMGSALTSGDVDVAALLRTLAAPVAPARPLETHS